MGGACDSVGSGRAGEQLGELRLLPEAGHVKGAAVKKSGDDF